MITTISGRLIRLSNKGNRLKWGKAEIFENAFLRPELTRFTFWEELGRALKSLRPTAILAMAGD
jgi:hypothetical protein